PRRTRRVTRKAAAPAPADDASANDAPANDAPAHDAPANDERAGGETVSADPVPDEPVGAELVAADPVRKPVAAVAPPLVLFRAPEATEPSTPAVARHGDELSGDELSADEDDEDDEDAAADESAEVSGAVDDDEDEGGPRRRRRRRGGRGRRRREGEESGESGSGEDTDENPAAASATSKRPEEGEEPDDEDEDDEADEDETSSGSSRRRRRRRRRRDSEPGEAAEPAPDDPPNTVVKLREPRRRESRENGGDDDEVRGVRGSVRLEAKKQRRREGREQGRRRPPVLSEAEFLARREAVERVMLVRQVRDRTQIAVLEDGILVEHYINRASATSFVGNLYLGRVQNVLPGMEAAFVDVGKGRNGVLYAGEVNWDAAGLEGQPKRIESAMKSGDSVLVQVTKDPIGHKGARLTSQISLPGRFLVYVPDGSMTGISRKLPDTERTRLKAILRGIVPEDAGVIVRTAAEGASEEELRSDVARLQAQWEDISRKAKTASAPALLYGEPDLSIRVIRDIFNEDFSQVVVDGEDVWDTLQAYVGHVAPDLVERLSRWTSDRDVFAEYRIDEQLAKALDRKVWLPSGGSLVIDRTEAMIVVDVNTGKFVGKGGNLEETVTKNNLEAAEEIVRQLRLRDLGGIIVIDFIDMVLESNRELVLRRLLECLGRDRTKHQVAEVTSLGLVQMTRKRVGQGLLEAFSETCEVCNGRGVRVHLEPIHVATDAAPGDEGTEPGEERAGRSRSRARRERREVSTAPGRVPTPADLDVRPAPDSLAAAAGGAAADEELTAEATAVEAAAAEADAGIEPATAATGEPESVGIFDAGAPAPDTSLEVAAELAVGRRDGESQEVHLPEDDLLQDDLLQDDVAEPALSSAAAAGLSAESVTVGD
ncbi:MAG: Rne/Rng family ribonuclease, partial [Actinomycetota bacterium]|nr:Rne/Rng family ribonuclease [Actinomycetota bacterium]